MNQSAEQNTHYTGNVILPLSILLICGVFFTQTMDFPEQEDVGPEVVPYLWMIILTIFCSYLIFQAVRKQGQADPVSGQLRTVFIYAAFVVSYLLMIERAGYFVSTLIFLVVSMISLGYRRPFISLTISLVWIIFSYAIFFKLLYIPLPIGPFLSPWNE